MVAKAERAEQAPLWSATALLQKSEILTDHRMEAFRKTQDFVKTAFLEGAHLRVPKLYNPKQWQRDIGILSECIREDRTDLDIALENGITKQAIFQIKMSTLQHLWENSSSQTQESFPLETLSLHKPLPIEKRRKMSEISGGVTSRVLGIVEQSNSPEELAERAQQEKIPNNRLGQALNQLKSWGVDVSRVVSKKEPFVDRVRKAETFRQKQDLLDQVPASYYKIHNKGEHALFISIINVASSVGFNRDTRNFFKFLEALIEKEIPFGMAEEHVTLRGRKVIERYYFLLVQDAGSARQAFLESPGLYSLRINSQRQYS